VHTTQGYIFFYTQHTSAHRIQDGGVRVENDDKRRAAEHRRDKRGQPYNVEQQPEAADYRAGDKK